MADGARLKKLGVTRGKAILIGVLAVILGMVLVSQTLTPGTAEKGPATRGRKPRAAMGRAAKSAPTRNDSTVNRRPSNALPGGTADWPIRNAVLVSAHDPFLKPAWADETAPPPRAVVSQSTLDANVAEKKREVLDSLRRRGVQLVMSDGNQKIAIIDGRPFRVGDELDGFRISDISDQGVTLFEQEAR